MRHHPQGVSPRRGSRLFHVQLLEQEVKDGGEAYADRAYQHPEARSSVGRIGLHGRSGTAGCYAGFPQRRQGAFRTRKRGRVDGSVDAKHVVSHVLSERYDALSPVSGTHGHAQGDQLADRSGQGENGSRCAQRRRVHLHRQQPKTDEAPSCRGRRDGDVCQAS